jgi:hypothetical protein
MAIRRAKQKAQVIELLSQNAPAGETFIACVHCETGPSPWLNALFDEIPFVGLIMALTRKFYFVTLTNTSIVVNRANRFTNRPGDIVAEYPRASAPISGINRTRVWSKMYLAVTPEKQPRRLNVHRYWRSELDVIISELPTATVPA